MHPATFPEICNGLLFRSILRMCVQTLKFVALPVSWDNRGYSKILGSPWIRPRSIFSQNFKGLLFGWTLWIYLPNLKFVASWDNRGYSKILGSPWIRPRSIFSQNFKGLLFGWTLWIYLPNLKFVASSVPEIIGGTQNIWVVLVYAHAPFSPKFLIGFLLFARTLWIYLPNLTFVALPIPEITGGTQKIWTVPGCAHTPFSPKILKGFCSDGPCEYTCQIWSL